MNGYEQETQLHYFKILPTLKGLRRRDGML